MDTDGSAVCDLVAEGDAVFDLDVDRERDGDLVLDGELVDVRVSDGDAVSVRVDVSDAVPDLVAVLGALLLRVWLGDGVFDLDVCGVGGRMGTDVVSGGTRATTIAPAPTTPR